MASDVTDGTGMQRANLPAAAARPETRVEDVFRYRTIASASALAVAVAASLLVTVLLRLVL